ncbi:transposase [Halomonas sp. DP5N14-9]|nr:transposase [Halomonas sp. DP5N14-9]
MVERASSRLKELRRIATRYDKPARSFHTMICLTCVSR